jgi:YVTN family beta-propeller protein
LHLAIAPDGTTVYVAEGSSSGAQTELFNAPALTLRGQLARNQIGDIAVSRDGGELYWTYPTKNSIVSETESGANFVSSPTGGNPRSLAVDQPIGGLWVANANDGNVGLYSVSPGATLVKFIDLGSGTGPYGIAVNSSRGLVVTANHDNNTVSVIDINQKKVVGSVSVGTHPDDVAIDSGGNTAYVVNVISHNLSVVDISTPSSPRVIKTIEGFTSPVQLALSVSPDGQLWAYVADLGASSVQVVDLAAGVIRGSVSLGGTVSDVVASPDGAFVYAAVSGANKLAELAVPQAKVTSSTNPTVAAGTQVTMKATVSGSPNAQQWQFSTDDGQDWFNITPSATGSNFSSTAKAADNGKWFRLHLIDTTFGDRYGDTVQLTVTGKDPASSGSGGSGGVTGTPAPGTTPTALPTPSDSATPGAAVTTTAAAPLDLRWVLVAGLGVLLIALLVVLSVVLIRQRPMAPAVAPAAPEPAAPESIPTAAASAVPTGETVIATVEPPTAPTVQLPQADGAAPTVAFAQPAANATPAATPRRPLGAIIALGIVGALLVIALVVVVTLVLVGRV